MPAEPLHPARKAARSINGAGRMRLPAGRVPRHFGTRLSRAMELASRRVDADAIAKADAFAIEPLKPDARLQALTRVAG